MAHPNLKFVSVLGVVLVGCAAPAPPAAAHPEEAANARPSMTTGGLSDADWGLVSSQRFLLAVPVPDAAGWRMDDRTGRWLVAAHAPSRSLLLLRSWREGSVVDHRGCEHSARSWRPDLFGRDASELMDRRPLGGPAGFDTEIGFSVRREGGVLEAVAAAVGADVRRCIALVFVTRVEGPDADRVAADRLLFATTRMLSKVESRSIEDRVKPVER